MILQVNQQGIETLKLVTKHGKAAEIQEHDVTVVTCMGSPQKEKREKNVLYSFGKNLKPRMYVNLL